MPSDALEALGERYWDAFLAHAPLYATLIGDRRFDTEFPDPSEEAEDAFASELASVVDAARRLDREALTQGEQVTLDVLTFAGESHIADVRARFAELAVSPMVGPQATLLRFAQAVSLPEPEDAEALVARYRRVDRWLESAADRLRIGVDRGRTPPRVAVEQVRGQLDGLLDTPVEDTPFLAPAPPDPLSEDRAARWRDELAAAVCEVVFPALARYRDRLVDDVAPHARPPERSGLVHLPDGEEVYAGQIRRYTTLDLTPDEAHATGLAEIEALADEYREVAGPLLGTRDPARILRRLREDPGLRFSTSEEVLAQARGALERAVGAVPDWFGRLPATPCAVRAMSPHEAEHGTIAYYLRPAADGSRPGTYVVNTAQPGTRTRYESEALAFHEAVPGHHLQIALAQERDDLPPLRRHSRVTAYVEGWALYTERLADEMGIYSGGVERLGMLSFDSWRAGRLVVDTGIHARGWSRQRAIDYLRENTPQAENNIANEVDRYIAWPAQALAYKIGQREISRLRGEAEAALGERFDVAGFHDTVLTPGPVPLGVLAQIVHAWVGR